MSKVVSNRELVVNQFKERFKENLKMCIYDGASLMDVDELTSACREVVQETLSFLSAEASGNAK